LKLAGYGRAITFRRSPGNADLDSRFKSDNPDRLIALTDARNALIREGRLSTALAAGVVFESIICLALDRQGSRV
jgi:hypothetical protein